MCVLVGTLETPRSRQRRAFRHPLSSPAPIDEAAGFSSEPGYDAARRATLCIVRDPRLYDSISSTYTDTRREDERVAARIHGAIGSAERVINVGAGTGNYEPRDRLVVGVEPSSEMISKRPPGTGPAVRAVAEALPFRSDSFDVATATLTLHHWQDRRQGMTEMRRVAPRQVILLFDPAETYRFWAIDYWPTALSLPSEQTPPTPKDVAEVLNVIDVQPVAIPIDCRDGFGAAFWGRPEAYLDSDVQQGMSWLAQLPRSVLAEGSARLDTDLRSGDWDRRYGQLRDLPELDVGYRLVTAQS
jgi:SAM-dependent methyltransferase